MITLEECIALSGFTREEIDSICEHEHIPEVAAAALADYLMHREKGVDTLREMIEDDIRAAMRRGDKAHAASLLATLRAFLARHQG